VLVHHPRDPLVVHPPIRRNTVVELGGDPRCTTRVVVGVDGADPRREPGVGLCPRSSSGGCLEPGVVRRSLDLNERAKPLQLEAGTVVGNERCGWAARGRRNWKRLTSSSPRRNTWPPDAGFSRSLVSLVLSARNAAFSTSRRRSSPPRSPAPTAAASRRRPAHCLGCSRDQWLSCPSRLIWGRTGNPEALGRPYGTGKKTAVDALQRRTRAGLVQVDGLPTKLLGVVLAGHWFRIISLPGRCWNQRVQEPGSVPDLEVLVSDAAFMMQLAERRRLLDANVAAAAQSGAELFTHNLVKPCDARSFQSSGVIWSANGNFAPYPSAE
jgi:hypothetical protein